MFPGRPDGPLLAAALLWSSPLTLRYTLLGRGYFLGTALVVVGAYLLSRRRITASIPLALSAYAVPTFVLHWPGLFALAFLREPLGALITAALAVGLYWPILDSVRSIGGGHLSAEPRVTTVVIRGRAAFPASHDTRHRGLGRSAGGNTRSG